jgi:hypothetical protein
MCDNTGVLVGRVNPWTRFLANPPETPEPKVVQAIRYYDAINFARRIHAPGLVTVGFIDTTLSAFNSVLGVQRFDRPQANLYPVLTPYPQNLTQSFARQF